MTTEPFHLSVNTHHEFNLQPEDAKNLDVLTGADGQFHILHNGQSFHATLAAVDYDARIFTFLINGNRYEVKISDHYERLIRELGLSAGHAQKLNTVKAPMPGLVLEILVTPGQEVQKGDPLIILEAMKMENVIKAAGEGRVKSVKAQKGAAVDKGQLLLEME